MASPLAHHLPSFASGEAPSASRRLTPLGSKPGKPDMPARSHVADAEERGQHHDRGLWRGADVLAAPTAVGEVERDQPE